MKKQLTIFIVFAAFLSLCSCQEKISVDDDSLAAVQTMIHATTKDVVTKTSLNYNDESKMYDVLWSEGDKIMVILSNGMSESRREFTLVDGAGSTNGTFSCPDNINWSDFSSIKAYYGYDGVDWPCNQKPADAGSISHVPMYAQIDRFSSSTAPDLSFKNAGGLLQIGLRGFSPVKKIRVESDEIDDITLTLPQSVKLDKNNAKIFNVAMPQRSTGYHGVKITVVDDLGNEFTKSYKGDGGLVVERSMITTVSLPVITINSDCENGTLGLYDGREAVLLKPERESGSGETWINLFVETENYNEGATLDELCYRYDASTYYYLDFTKYYFTTFNHRTGTEQFPKTKWGMPKEGELGSIMEYVKSNGSWDSIRNGWSVPFGDHDFFIPADGYVDWGDRKEYGVKGYYWTITTSSSEDYNYYIYTIDKDGFARDTRKNPYRGYSLSVRRVCSFPENQGPLA